MSRKLYFWLFSYSQRTTTAVSSCLETTQKGICVSSLDQTRYLLLDPPPLLFFIAGSKHQKGILCKFSDSIFFSNHIYTFLGGYICIINNPNKIIQDPKLNPEERYTALNINTPVV